MNMKKQNFNLVEIIIAMGIVIVCVTTIMGMFSVGMKISNTSIMKSYSNNIVEQLGGFAETHPKATATNAIPNSKASRNNSAIKFMPIAMHIRTHPVIFLAGIFSFRLIVSSSKKNFVLLEVISSVS